MQRILDVPREGRPRVLPDGEVPAPPPEGVVRWIDLERPEPDEVRRLADTFGFHPLAIEDCLHFDQRPKLEEYPDYVFVVTHGFEVQPEGSGEPRSQELHSFLGGSYLVTVHDEPIQPLDEVWRRLATGDPGNRRGPDFIRYLIADAMVDALFPVVDDVAARIDELEAALVERGSQPVSLDDLLRLKRLLVTLRRLLPLQRDVLAQLAKRDGVFVRSRTALYFRDVHDHLLRINEAIDANRELLGSVLDAYHWSVSQRTNEIMKRLTIVSAVFLPLTFITGFFGQNFDALPFESRALMGAMLASCILVPGVMIWLFLRSRWF